MIDYKEDLNMVLKSQRIKIVTMRKSKPKKRYFLPDPIYKDSLVTQFVNNLMLKGKKSLSYSIFYIAHKFYGGKIPFWDFHITYCASKTFFLENFPYGLNVHGDCLHPNITLTANYSPGTLEILKYLGSLNIISANILWVFFEIISFFIIFYVMKKIFKFNYNLRNLLLTNKGERLGIKNGI